MRGEARIRAGILILAAIVAGGCALESLALPVRPSVVVIHGVLSPSATAQVILVERTLTGAVPVSRVFPGEGVLPSNSVSSTEPILSDGGDPVQGAIVELELPDGSVIVAPEWTTTTPLNWGSLLVAAILAAVMPFLIHRAYTSARKGFGS